MWKLDSTDRNTELAILEVVRERFPNHLILGEEGGVSGDPTSEYLWCIDPLGMFPCDESQGLLLQVWGLEFQKMQKL